MQVDIFIRPFCGFCSAAKQLLENHNVVYNQYDIWEDPAHKQQMLLLNPSAKTVPQIFIDKQLIGGYDDLKVIADKGQLDSMLGRS